MMSKPKFYMVPNSPTRRCRSCNAKIIWTTSPNGAHVPLSFATIRYVGNYRYAFSHFTDCPHASAWSGNAEPEPEQQPEQPPLADQLTMFE
jgi:hypothetical protein